MYLPVFYKYTSFWRFWLLNHIHSLHANSVSIWLFVVLCLLLWHCWMINSKHSPFRFMCLTVFFHNLCSSPLWCGTLHFMLHMFHHPIIVFFSQHMHIPSQPVAAVPRICHLFLVSVISTWSSIFYINVTHPSDHSHLCPLKCHLIFFLQARSHFHAT